METAIKMVVECVDRYHVSERSDGRTEINIVVPERFSNLWKVRLSELTTTKDQIDEFDKA
jgi:hypothetical protein